MVFDGSHVEPTDDSMQEAIEFARDAGPFDAYVAVGGGSSIDTAKAINLLMTNDGELMDYINVPVGQGRSPAKPLKPLVAVPTTAGTGSESTTVCVLDVLSLKVKTGISHPRLRPTHGGDRPRPHDDPAARWSPRPAAWTSCATRWRATRRAGTPPTTRSTPEQRVPYCGSNPIADMWSEKAMSLLGAAFRTAVHNGDDHAARHDMALAATFAGMGFGNAGVHIPHANGYPIAGRVRGFHPADYPGDEPMVPHGMSVALTAPEAFRFTFDASPERHLRAAALLDPSSSGAGGSADTLPSVIIALMRDIGMPNGIGAVGYGEGDVDDLVEGTLKQQRLLTTCPREVTAEDLGGIFRSSLELW